MGALNLPEEVMCDGNNECFRIAKQRQEDLKDLKEIIQLAEVFHSSTDGLMTRLYALKSKMEK